MKKFPLVVLILILIVEVGQCQKLSTPDEISKTIELLNSDIVTLRGQLQKKNDEKSQLTKTAVDLYNDITRTQQSIIDTENRKKNEKSEDAIKQYDLTLKTLGEQLQSIQNQFNIASKLEGDVQELNRQIEAKANYLKTVLELPEYQKLLTELKTNLLSLTASTKEAAQKKEEEIRKANESIENEKRQRKDYLKKEINYLCGNVEAWTSMSDKYELLAISAESLLLFDEKTNKKIWRAVKNSSLDLSAFATWDSGL